METYELIVNGVPYPVTAPVDRNLVTVLRENVGLTGTKEGCDDCECRAACSSGSMKPSATKPFIVSEKPCNQTPVS